jgi:hypothetical protein
MKDEGSQLIREHLKYIIGFAKINKEKADRSWPVLLKSNNFFTYIMAYLAGIRKEQHGAPAAAAKPAVNGKSGKKAE